MKFFRSAVTALLVLAALLAPFSIVIGAAVLTPSQYSNTFVGALNEKYERLYSIKGDKIVFVGGSSVAFGVDSKLIEKYAQRPVVNFGLYAALGTKLMLDLSRSAIKEGDLVVISPELDPQTLSLYFSSEQTLTALDDNFSMFWDVAIDDQLSLLGGMWSFATNKLKLMASGTTLDPDGIYNASHFNEYGDLVYPRPANVMDLYYDESTPINLSSETVSPEFIDYLNEYIAYCEEQGAKVVFAYCPMNERAVVDKTTAERFHKFLEESLDCEIIGNINDSMMDAGYFYDTNFHLNDTGVAERSIRLARDVLFALEIPRAVLETSPEPPELPETDVRYFGDEDPSAKYFKYEKREDGSYKIVGLTYNGKQLTTLTIPLGYDTYKVTAIAADAFVGSKATRITIPENTNIRMLENGCLNGTTQLQQLYILYPKAESLTPPADFFGTPDGFKIYVPAGSNYDTDYNWVEVVGIKRILVYLKEN